MPDSIPERTASEQLVLYTDTEGADVRRAVDLLKAAGLAVRVEDLHTEDELVALVSELQPAALLVTYLPVGERVFEAAPSIRLVACSSVGFDRVDIEAASRRGVWVSNVPDAATEEVASHAFAMALALARHLPLLDRHVKSGGWDYEATGVPRRLSQMRLGVVGLGRIGHRFAQMAGGLFAETVGHDPNLPATAWPANIRRVSLAECLASSDLVSLHLPRDPGSPPILDAAAIASMRPGAFVVNVSRGGLIDADALLAALDGGRLAGAALDVTDPEPPDPDSPLRHHPRILITPHAAFYSAEALEGYIIRQAENAIALSRQGRPATPVNSPSELVH